MQKEQPSLFIYVLLGLLIGVGLDGLFYQKVAYIYPYLWISSFALLFAIAFDFRHQLRILFTSALAAAITCSPFLFLGPDAPNTNNINLMIAVICFPFAMMIAHAFHFAYHLDDQIRVRYTSLFYAVWNTIPLLIIAGVFAFITKLLIWLTAAIFSAFKFTTLANFLLLNQHFWIISTVCFYIIGIGIARQNLTILDNFRLVILKLFYYLYPFLAVISLIYLLLFAMSAYGGNTPESATAIFVALSILGIIFFNAIFQDGEAQTYQSSGLRIFLNGYRVLLLLIAILTAYRLYPDAKPINNALLLLAILVLYGLSYGISAVLPIMRKKQWIQSANIFIAIFYILCYLLINNPFYPSFVDSGATVRDRYDAKSFQQSDYQRALPQIKGLLEQQDVKLAHLGLTWQNPTSHGKPLENLCRAHLSPFGWLVGTVLGNQCLIASTSQTFKEKGYQILTGNPSIIAWGSANNSIPFSMGVEWHNNAMKAQSICRIKINDSYQIGTRQAYGCVLPKQGSLSNPYQQFEVLTINADGFPDKMGLFLDDLLADQGFKFVSPPVDNYFVAGINAKGSLGICRGTYKKGLQIGSFQDDQCTISYGGKAFLLSNYTVLKALSTAPKITWRPTPYRALIMPSNSLLLGFELTPSGTLRTLEACRGIYDNAIHIGKIIDYQCNIAVEEQEKRLDSGLFTSLQPK
ncbi:hypothetical protein [Legionella sp. W05-934-2]|uniref:hypothetical protein n=1 Tax=Legionella sp. W05-934-2 TaxID=1198649 RepID=UPI003462F43E